MRGARAREPDRRPHRLPGGPVPADGDRPRGRVAFAARTDGRVVARSLDIARHRRPRRRPAPTILRASSPRGAGPSRRRSPCSADEVGSPPASTRRSRARCRSAPGSRRARRFGVALALARRRPSAGSISHRPTSRSWRRKPSSSRAACRAACMDQLASVRGRAGHALLLDCRSLEVGTGRDPADRGGARRAQRPRTPPRGERVRRAPRGVRSRGGPARTSRPCATRRSSRLPTTRSRATS